MSSLTSNPLHEPDSGESGSVVPRRQDFLRIHLRSLPLHRALLRSVECSLLARYVYPRPILDVGVGDGHFGEVLFSEGVDAGIDPDVASLREAKSRGVYGSLAVASACDLPYGDGVFGSVVSNCVLEHIPDLDSALDEIARVLRAGGRFAFTVPSPCYESYLLGSTVLRVLGLPAAARAYGGFMTRISRHFHYLDPEAWRHKLAERGLEVEHWQYYFPPHAHRMFDLSHYLSAPSLFVRKATGRWLLFPEKPGLALQQKLFAHFSQVGDGVTGAYIAFACVRRSMPAAGSMRHADG